jgi:hypothetical protein
VEQLFRAVRLEVQTVAANGQVSTPAPQVPDGNGGTRPARAELSGFYFVVHEVVNAEDAERTGLKAGSETTNVVRFPVAPAVAKLLASAILDQLGDADHEPGGTALEVVQQLPGAGMNREQRRAAGRRSSR